MIGWVVDVPLLLCSILGLLLNGFNLFVMFWLHKEAYQHVENTLLVTHLGLVEFAISLVTLAFASGFWLIGDVWCDALGFLFTVLHPIALWTVAGINYDRYIAVAAPLHYVGLISSPRVAYGLAGLWIVTVPLCMLPFWGIVPFYRYRPGIGCCAPDFGNSLWGITATIYGVVYVILGLIVPVVFITVWNLHVLTIARRHRHRIAGAIIKVALDAQVAITHQQNPFLVPTVTVPMASPSHSAATTVIQLLSPLYVLYVPYCCLILWEVSDVDTQPQLLDYPELASTTTVLLALTPSINGLVYAMKSQSLRYSIQNYWRKKTTQSEFQQEIDARTPSAAGSRRPSGSGTGSSVSNSPLQRTYSEAVLTAGPSRAKLQPAASCNTLRVPTFELGESSKIVRSSTSSASLMGPHYQNACIRANVSHSCCIPIYDTPKKSPKILITEACNEEVQDGGITFARKPPVFGALQRDKRRLRHYSTESDSSTGSSETCVWTTGAPQKLGKLNEKTTSNMWPFMRKLHRKTSVEEDEEDEEEEDEDEEEEIVLITLPPAISNSDNLRPSIIRTTATIPRGTMMKYDDIRPQRKEEMGDRKGGVDDCTEDRQGCSSVDDTKGIFKKIAEVDNLARIEFESEGQNGRELKRKSKTIRKADVPQDGEEIEQRKHLLLESS